MTHAGGRGRSRERRARRNSVSVSMAAGLGLDSVSRGLRYGLRSLAQSLEFTKTANSYAYTRDGR